MVGPKAYENEVIFVYKMGSIHTNRLPEKDVRYDDGLVVS